jgi:hypothetical protein
MILRASKQFATGRHKADETNTMQTNAQVLKVICLLPTFDAEAGATKKSS